MDHPTRSGEVAGRFCSDPHPSLRGVVVEYWGFSRDLGAQGGFDITPDRFGELICCPDELCIVEAGARRRLPRTFVIGLLDGPMRVESPGVVRCMSARLHAWALGRVFAADPDGAQRRWQDAGRLFGDREARLAGLVERLDWGAGVALYDELLRGLYPDADARACGSDLAGPFLDEGAGPTSDLARDRGVTRRQVEREVRAMTRASPKRLACLARFQRARDAIWADPTIDLVRLALDVGYSDQPHMTRAFRRYAGQTPARFARASAARKHWLASQYVAFVQEREAGDS
jgi:AraC-like DNA-binding protein